MKEDWKIKYEAYHQIYYGQLSTILSEVMNVSNKLYYSYGLGICGFKLHGQGKVKNTIWDRMTFND